MDERDIKKDPNSSVLLTELNERHASLHKKPLEGKTGGYISLYILQIIHLVRESKHFIEK